MLFIVCLRSLVAQCGRVPSTWHSSLSWELSEVGYSRVEKFETRAHLDLAWSNERAQSFQVWPLWQTRLLAPCPLSQSSRRLIDTKFDKRGSVGAIYLRCRFVRAIELLQA